jgi:hypothetical protein
LLTVDYDESNMARSLTEVDDDHSFIDWWTDFAPLLRIFGTSSFLDIISYANNYRLIDLFLYYSLSICNIALREAITNFLM